MRGVLVAIVLLELEKSSSELLRLLRVAPRLLCVVLIDAIGLEAEIPQSEVVILGDYFRLLNLILSFHEFLGKVDGVHDPSVFGQCLQCQIELLFLLVLLVLSLQNRLHLLN